MILADIFLQTTLLSMFIQDLYERKIYLFLFILNFIAALVYASLSNQINFGIHQILMNLLVTSLLIAAVLISKIFLRTQKSKTIIGGGDILFFFCITPILRPMEFINFISLSLLITLLIFSTSIHRNRNFKIPLAGMQSLLLSIYLLARNHKVFDLNHIIQFL